MAITPGSQFNLNYRATFPGARGREPFVYRSTEKWDNPARAMQSISRLEREEPVDERTEYGVNEGPMRLGSTREGRTQIASDLGLPNKKLNKRNK